MLSILLSRFSPAMEIRGNPRRKQLEIKKTDALHSFWREAFDIKSVRTVAPSWTGADGHEGT